jgi:hypothetical protein
VRAARHRRRRPYRLDHQLACTRILLGPSVRKLKERDRMIIEQRFFQG